MNKKLQKGLTTAMAAAMGAGMVVPTVAVLAANTTNGWVKSGTSWNFLKNGAKVTGWSSVNGSWYFFNASGEMQTGWAKVDGAWYFLNTSGAMQKGWAKVNGSWYFLNASGVVQTGWASVNGQWYYMNAGGDMAVSKTVDGWTLDANGVGTKGTVVVPPVVADLAVSSVSATSANSVAVTFNRVPEDASKLAFVVAQTGTAVAVTTAWNAAGTVVTLTKASKFTTGVYTVNVKNGTKDLGTSNVTMSEQKVAKINITSTKLGVHTDQKTSAQKGYAVYNILDQYGVDITNGALANNVQFQTGVGNIEAKKGLLTITPTNGLNLLTFNAGVTITANETSTGVNGTATLAVTSQPGTLSAITLTTLTNVDNKVLTAGDTTDIFYAGFTATDVSGNPTSNYTLMKEGLIFTGNTSDCSLTTSTPYVTAKLVQDPKDSNKGVIEVRATNDSLSVDMPLIISANTWMGGATAQINTTLRKQAEVDSFTVLAPNDSIASGESKNIPFSAIDQNGVALTKLSDFPSNLVTFNNLIATRNSDGTLCLKNVKQTNNGTSSVPEVLSAMTKSGKYSSVTINIQKPTLADTLTLDDTILHTVMQEQGASGVAAVQMADFGWDNGGLNIIDQYGRTIDINDSENSNIYKNYKVTAKSSDENVIKVGSKYTDGDSATGFAGKGENEIAIQSFKNGAATVTFNLVDTTKLDSNKEPIIIDSKTQTFTVLKDIDIKDYVMDAVTDPIYVSNGVAGIVTGSKQAADWDANPTVYGTTSTGAKVVLRGTPIIGATSTSTDFTVIKPANKTTFAPDDIELVANKILDPAKTGSSTILAITLMGADGISHVVTTPVTSTTVDPLAKSFDVSVKTEVAGISKIDDVITLKGDYKALLGTTLAKYNEDGSKTGVTKNVYFAPVDQYGSKAWPLSQCYVVDSNIKLSDGTSATSRTNGSTFQVNNRGMISGTMVTGDWVTVAATTTNGLSKTIRINFGGSSTSTDETVVTTALAAINGGTEVIGDFATVGITGTIDSNLGAYKTAISIAKATKGSALTVAEIQMQVNAINTSSGVTAFGKINTGTAVIGDYASAGITAAIVENLVEYKTAIGGTVTTPAALSLTQIQVKVNTVNLAEAITGLTAINANTATIADFAKAGVTGAIVANVADYKTAITAVKTTKGSALTLTEVQTTVNAVNSKNSATTAATALGLINANTAQIADFVTAGVTDTIASYLGAYNTAITAAKTAKGSLLTLAEVQTTVNTVNSTAVSTAVKLALDNVNAATDVVKMQLAFTDVNLGLTLTTYNTLTASHKNIVAQDVLNKMPAKGYATVADVVAEFNAIVAAQ